MERKLHTKVRLVVIKFDLQGASRGLCDDHCLIQHGEDLQMTMRNRGCGEEDADVGKEVASVRTSVSDAALERAVKHFFGLILERVCLGRFR